MDTDKHESVKGVRMSARSWSAALQRRFPLGVRVGKARVTGKRGGGPALQDAVALLLAPLLMCVVIPVASAADEVEFFEKRVRPVLAKNCHQCHSTDAKKLKAGLYLDTRSGLLTGGESGPAIVPGKPEASRLVRAVEYHDIHLQMPPRKKLEPQQIVDLKEWIRNGAVWPGSEGETKRVARGGFDVMKRKAEFWAWQPIETPLIPFRLNTDWPRDHIDYFIQAKLADKGLTPMKDAGRSTLIRRATFDLTGLPPTPEEVEAFVNDKSDDAFAKVVDRLLDSDRYGERWARHWLDMVRYSETLGHEFDYTIHNAWRYRDYAIRAFNSDVPYDQFMKEHVAGDLLVHPRRNAELGINESIIGTSFYWFGQQKHSPVDIRQETADTIDNQIDVLTKTFMGMTVSCARCHDHKFDAISTKDYYALFGVLGSSRYAQRSIDEEKAVGKQVSQLVQLRQQVKEFLQDHISPELKRTRDYVAAALEVRNAAAANPPDSADIVFEDFESGNFDRWTATGNAFTGGPRTQSTVGSYQGDIGAQGRFFVNSHNTTKKGKETRSDRFTGTLTSPEFTITKPFIRFLIGGGGHQGKTCINLLINGKAVSSQAGPNHNRMRPAQFSVGKYIGKQAQIQAVDEMRGGWGNVGLDHIVFSDDGGGEIATTFPSAKQVTAYAKKHGLVADVLSKWVKALDTLNGLKQAVDVPGEAFADFAGDDLEDWFFESAAFPPDAGKEKEVIMLADGSVSFLDQGWVSSALLSKRLQGAFRSPTFPVEKDYIHLLVAGSGTRINAVVDNFTIIKNPIWGGLKGEIKNEEPHWVTLDLRMAQGRRAWLEFLDQSNGDPSGKGGYPRDGWFAVRKVMFSDERKAPAINQRHAQALRATQLNGARLGGFASAVRNATQSLGDASLLNWLSANGLLMGSDSKWSRLVAKRREIEASIPDIQRVPSMTEGRAHNEHVFIRGGHRNTGDEVPRRFLEAIQGSTDGFKTTMSGRLELAQWLVDKGNPLPARVAVNKVWHHLMGRGIVGSVDNFGVLGERPSHPELLDHLAGWFRDNGWSTKGLIRRIMLSRTYQMASTTGDAVAEEKDPKNLLLHRANVKRLEGEALRDAILSITGSFDDEMYGEPVPVYLTSFMEGRGRPRTSGPLDGNGRRTIYGAVRRNFLSPMMTAFDTPPPATTVGRRAISNVPAQALILMNDPLVVLQSQRWSERLVGADLNDRELVTRMYRRMFGRNAGPDEAVAAVGFLEEQTKLQDGSREKAIADLAHVLFNVKEFMFVN